MARSEASTGSAERGGSVIAAVHFGFFDGMVCNHCLIAWYAMCHCSRPFWMFFVWYPIAVHPVVLLPAVLQKQVGVSFRKVDIRLAGKGDSNSLGTRPVY